MAAENWREGQSQSASQFQASRSRPLASFWRARGFAMGHPRPREAHYRQRLRQRLPGANAERRHRQNWFWRGKGSQMTVKINVTIGLGSELRWEQVDFKTATLHVRRVKRGTPSTHPVLGDELCALPRLQREQDARSPFVC